MQADQRLLKEIDLPLETRGRFGWEEQASSGVLLPEASNPSSA